MRIIPPTTLSLALASLFGLGLACADRGSQTATDGRQEPATAPDPQTAAAQSLATFRQLVNDTNYRELGFESAAEVANATLGEPLRVMFVRLDRLRAYQPGDPDKLLTDLHQINYPVLVNQSTRSSVVVQEENGRWKTATLGNGALARQIAEARKTMPAAGASPPFVLHVGALGLYFSRTAWRIS